jgi:nicotinate-nucleotide pyrophosphorylase (carboxylating)
LLFHSFRHLAHVEPLKPDAVLRAVREALAEDIGSGDVTTLATVPVDRRASARMVAREQLVVAGLDFAETTFRQVAPEAEIIRKKADGEVAALGQTLLAISGPARSLLTAERVALNFVQRLSGVATLTAAFVESVKGTAARILDTRKTTPGWRTFEKYAVVCGGGTNHRFGLFDLVLIKDNHLATLRGELPNPIQAAVGRARKLYPNLKVEVEVDTLEQLDDALAARADIVLLDNMTLAQMCAAVEKCRGRAKTEASGGVTLGKVRAIAETGVDYISAGALTHSARAVDIALDFETDLPR